MCITLTGIGRRFALVLLAAAMAQPAVGQGERPGQPHIARVPLGIYNFQLQPADERVTLLASAESPEFEGLRPTKHGERRMLLRPDGTQVSQLPSRITFRLTATLRDVVLNNEAAVPFTTGTVAAELLRALRFRVSVFRGLEQRHIEPDEVELIGMAESVPYPDRVYLIRTRLGRVEVNDRVMLEVFAPTGERMCKFYLQLD